MEREPARVQALSDELDQTGLTDRDLGALQSCDPGGVHVGACHPTAETGQARGRGQSHVPGADDGSTDGSRDVLAAVDDPRVSIVLQPHNMGKGAALRRGFAAASSDFVVVRDAGLEHSPNDWDLLLEPLLRQLLHPTAAMGSGSWPGRAGALRSRQGVDTTFIAG